MRYNGSGGWTEGEVWAEGNHLAIYANGQTYFPLTDQVGTERARFVSTGGIVQTCMSQPFGDNLQCTGTDSSPYKFGKLERDLESGDDHAQQRDYNSNPYRWLTPDPAGEKVVVLTDPQTWNMYAYVRNNPATKTDPSGLCTVDGENHNWVWCAAHALGITTTLQERRDWLVQNVVVTQGGRVISNYWNRASAAEVNDEYNRAMAYEAIDRTLSIISPIMWTAAKDLVSGPPSSAAGMIGANGAQFMSKTLWSEGGARIDVENPAPGQRAGQIHYQDASGKYLYDFETGQFQGMSRTKSAELLSRPEVQDAIQKGLKYLGM
jgi:RHS repeat-associated protein